jgi:membrane fusion protein (multidrug efflux system)
VVVLGVLVGLGAPATSYLLREAFQPSTNDAYIEGRAVRISPRVSGPVVALNVDDNSLVKAGDVLLEIDPAEHQAKVDQAAAAVAVAESSIQQSEAAVLRAEAAVGEAAAALGSAEADSRHRASDYRRYAAMGTDGVSAQQLESAQTAADVGERQREAAEKKLAAANAELNVSRVNVATARSQLVAAQAQLRFAELQLQYTRVIAPESGVVTKKNVENGSFVSTAQPLMAIVPADCWITANFKEVQLEHMRVGQAAEIRVDAYPSLRLRGRVQSIQAGTGSRFQLLPPENATGNWVKVVQRVPVKIVLDEGQRGLELLALGMSVDVRVDTRKGEAASPNPVVASGGEGR